MKFGSFQQKTAAILVLLTVSCAAFAETEFVPKIERSISQTIYVPSYSHAITKEGRSEPLASTLFVHNVDPEQDISITGIDYHDENGRPLKKFLQSPITLPPFGSTRALVPIGSFLEGNSANFIVTWSATNPSLPPLVETVMMGGSGTQGISLTSRGRVIDQKP